MEFRSKNQQFIVLQQLYLCRCIDSDTSYEKTIQLNHGHKVLPICWFKKLACLSMEVRYGSKCYLELQHQHCGKLDICINASSNTIGNIGRGGKHVRCLLILVWRFLCRLLSTCCLLGPPQLYQCKSTEQTQVQISILYKLALNKRQTQNLIYIITLALNSFRLTLLQTVAAHRSLMKLTWQGKFCTHFE